MPEHCKEVQSQMIPFHKKEEADRLYLELTMAIKDLPETREARRVKGIWQRTMTICEESHELQY